MGGNEQYLRRKIADFIRDTLQMELLNQGHVASEALFNSIECVTEKTLFAFDFTAHALFYAEHVNDGRKKHKRGIPIDALIGWMRLRKFDLKGKRETSVAFALQRSIKEKGIKPSRFIDRAARRIDRSARLEKNVEQFMEEFVEEQILRIIEKLS